MLEVLPNGTVRPPAIPVCRAGVIVRLPLALALAVSVAACAARVPPVPAVQAHPDFVYPSVPKALQGTRAASLHDRGWRYLQADDPGRAGEAFGSALERRPDFYPALAGQGYVALAVGRHTRALEAFEASLQHAVSYAPALVGRGQALLALERGDEAAAAFEAAMTADPSLSGLRGRVQVLRFRSVQERIERARGAADAGRLDEARTAYVAALAASPDSAFLHRELGMVERRRGAVDEALGHLRRAVELDPTDAASLIAIGELLEARNDFDGALDAYRRALELGPDEELATRIAATGERARDARLPPEFREIPSLPQLTRGDLAALLGVRFEPVIAAAPVRQVVMTDTRGHWAETWIRLVAGAGVMDPFENHTFQPAAPVRRVDLATAVRSLALLIDSRRPELSLRLADRPAIADVTPTHLSYPAVSFVVASGLMPMLEGNRFQVSRAVSGAEAIAVVERLRALATGR